MPRILYVQYTNPAGYPPLEHSSRMLADAGWEVLFLGTGALGAGALRFPQHSSINVLQMAVRRAGWRQKLHFLRFCAWVLAIAIRWRPNWVYASDFFAGPVAVLVSWLPRVRLVYHEHDSPEELPASLFMRFVLWCRRVLARRADICILPNEFRAQQFTSQTGAANVVCVWNCPSRDEVASKCPCICSSDTLSVLYHGSVVPARLPKTILEALAILPDRVRLRVIGYETVGHAGYIQELKENASRLGIAARVDFLGTLPTRSEVLDWCLRSNLGLALMPKVSSDTNEQHMAGASNKAFDYMARGLPLLVADLPDWRKLYADPGFALTCVPEDPESIAGALRWFLEHPIELREMGERGRKRISEEWNYENQFAPVWERLVTNPQVQT